MNRDDIMRMAREAHRKSVSKDYTGYTGQLDPWTILLLENFAALVAANEREACADICERRKSLYWMEFDKTGSDADRAAAIASEECADDIRARGDK